MLPRLLVLSVLVSLVAFGLTALSDTPPKPGEEKGKAPLKLPSEAESMAVKLKYAQELLDAITRENFKKIEENAVALEHISEGAEIMKTHKTEAYVLQARLFQQTMLTMAARAREKNIEGVLLAYHDMSSSCLKCHKYIRDTKKRD
jgi:hypothetical protein